MVDGAVAGPDVERVNAEALGEAVGGEGRAAGVGADEPDVLAGGEDAVAFPLALHHADANAGRELADAEGDHADVDATAGGVGNGGAVAADLFDIAGQECGGLVNGGVFGVGDDDAGDGAARGERHVTGRGGAGLDPGAAQDAGPGGGLGGGESAEGEQKAGEGGNSRSGHTRSF